MLRSVINVQVEILNDNQSRITVTDSTTLGIDWVHVLIVNQDTGKIEYHCPECKTDPDLTDPSFDSLGHGQPEINWLENIVNNIFPDWEF